MTKPINTRSDFFLAKTLNGAVDYRPENGQPETWEEVKEAKICLNSI